VSLDRLNVFRELIDCQERPVVVDQRRRFFWNRLLELGFRLRIGLVMARPDCPPRQPGLMQEPIDLSHRILDVVGRFEVPVGEKREPHLPVKADVLGRIVEVGEELGLFVVGKFWWAARPDFGVRCFMDWLVREPSEPVTNCLKGHIVSLSQLIRSISLGE